jgi:hypothetical protein
MFRSITKLTLALALASSTLFAQMRMTVDQLRAFVQSSKQLGHSDKQVADYLKKVKLVNQLDDSAIEDMQGLGAGPKTVEVLKSLADGAKSLPPPPPPPPRVVTVAAPGPDAREQGRILQDVREYALDYVKHLPNFICTQVTRRYVDPSGLEFWHLLDTVTAKLSYFEQKENYKVIMVGNRAVDTSMDKIGGATSSGEFGSMMREIFSPDSEAQFEWDHWGKLRGKLMYVFSYRVPQARSRWRVVYENSQSIVPGYRGLVYIEKDTLAVMRITLEGEDIPPTFPVQQAMTSLDYDYQDISGQQFVLPLKAEIRMRSGKTLIKNESEFRLYHKYGAEATITYDTPAPLPPDTTKEQPVAPAPPK